jgi:hypothetical protein
LSQINITFPAVGCRQERDKKTFYSEDEFRSVCHYILSRQQKWHRKRLEGYTVKRLKQVENIPVEYQKRKDSMFLKDKKEHGKIDFHSLLHILGL